MTKFTALVTFMLGVVMALIPFSASAHTVMAYHGKDYAYAGKNHYVVGVKDVECDGNPVYALVWLNNGNMREFKAGTCKDPVREFSVGSEIKYIWACEGDECQGPATKVT